MTTFNDIQANSLILVTCPKGLSSFLAEEVATLKFNVLSNFQSGVSLRGSFQDCMPLNLGLSTAHHVLFLLKEFSCASPETLYKEIASIDWENIVPRGGYVSVTSVVHTPSILDTRFANLKCKDAIMDRLADKTGKRCDSGNLRDRTVVHLYWNDDRCIVYLDTSGEPLSKRGYRLVPGSAPMQETLAAAVVRTTGWTGGLPLINPMCGSGHHRHRGGPSRAQARAGDSPDEFRLHALRRVSPRGLFVFGQVLFLARNRRFQGKNPGLRHRRSGSPRRPAQRRAGPRGGIYRVCYRRFPGNRRPAGAGGGDFQSRIRHSVGRSRVTLSARIKTSETFSNNAAAAIRVSFSRGTSIWPNTSALKPGRNTRSSAGKSIAGCMNTNYTGEAGNFLFIDKSARTRYNYFL